MYLIPMQLCYPIIQPCAQPLQIFLGGGGGGEWGVQAVQSHWN